jgi:hypothetical protein
MASGLGRGGAAVTSRPGWRRQNSASSSQRPPHIDELILNHLRTFLEVPVLTIVARWHGVYIKHPTEPYLIAQAGPGALAVTGVGGAGMTLSFGLAEQVVADWLGGES